LFLISPVAFIPAFNHSSSPGQDENPYLQRIGTTFETFKDKSEFSQKEASLATRVISDKLNLLIFMRHPLIGVGLNMSSSYSGRVLGNLDMPLTKEYMMKIARNKYPGLNSSLLFTSLAEFGLIGTALFYIFLCYSVYTLHKIRNNLYGIDTPLCIGIEYSILARLCVSFYDFHIYDMFFWLLLGFVPLLYLKSRENIKYKKYYFNMLLSDKTSE